MKRLKVKKETIRLLSVSPAKNTTKILKYIKEHYSEEVEVALHAGGMDSDQKASSLSRMKMRTVRGKKHPMLSKPSDVFRYAILEEETFAQEMSEFMDHLYRQDTLYSHKAQKLGSMQDYMDYYYILFDTLASDVVEKQITHMLFFNIPHLAYDTVYYHIAKLLEIKTLIVTQSIFPGKYFSMRTVEDYGYLCADDIAYQPEPIDTSKEMNHFYMKHIKQERGEFGRLSLKAVVQIIKYIILKKPSCLLSPKKLYELFFRAVKLYRLFPNWRDPFARYFHENEFAYFEHIAGLEENAYDLKKPYIYFAMQLQPEMTTSALGGWFKDQALAIETLSAMLPENAQIYVKENPKQGAYMRGSMFFHRLNRLPNVTLLPSYASTHQLTDHSLFVSTVSGTVGWEAIRKGKKVLVFGETWYRTFPGVFTYNEELTYEVIVSYKIDHDELEERLGLLLASAHDGVVDRHYVQIAKNYDKENNIKKVAQMLVSLLKEDQAVSFKSTKA